MEHEKVWFWLVLFGAGAFAQSLGLSAWAGAVVRFLARDLWAGAWRFIVGMPSWLTGTKEQPPAAGGGK